MEYPVSFEDLMKIVSGQWFRLVKIPVQRKKDDSPPMMPSETKIVHVETVTEIEEKILDGFDGNPSSNLTNFLTNFGLAWNYIGKDQREPTLENLRKLYNCINNPFLFDKELANKREMSIPGTKIDVANKWYDKRIQTQMREILMKLELTEELRNAVVLFERMTGQMVVPKLPRIENILKMREMK